MRIHKGLLQLGNGHIEDIGSEFGNTPLQWKRHTTQIMHGTHQVILLHSFLTSFSTMEDISSWLTFRLSGSLCGRSTFTNMRFITSGNRRTMVSSS